MSTSMDRRYYHGETQLTKLRSYIQSAHEPEGRRALKGRIARALAGLEALGGTGLSAAPDSRVREWYEHHEDLGSLYGVLAKWARGEESRSFERALRHLEFAVQVPQDIGDGHQWSLAHNNKGAVHYWYAMWLAGGPSRGLLGDVDPEGRSLCMGQMNYALHHYGLALEIREPRALEGSDDTLQVWLQMLAQTYQNIGTAQMHLAWWSKVPQLAEEALETLRRVEPLKEHEFIAMGFPDLDQDIEHARAILEGLRADRDGWASTESLSTLGEGQSDPGGGRDVGDATLHELWEEFMAPLPESVVSRVAALVQEAQSARPSDPKGFVKKVNDLVLRHGLQFLLERDGSFARLKVTNNSIQFVRKGRGGGLSFKQPFTIVFDDSGPAGVHRVSRSRGVRRP